MGIFGHSSRILVSTSNVTLSLSAWTCLGFDVLLTDSEDAPTFARLTDGQVIVTLLNDGFPNPSLAYFSEAVPRVLQRAKDKSVPVDTANPNEPVVHGPGGLDVFLHHLKRESAILPSRAQNPALGYFDVLLVRVADVQASRTWAESAGFLVETVTTGAVPRIDMTDGVSRIGFLQSEQSGRELVYISQFGDDFIQELSELDGVTCDLSTLPDGTILFVRLTMPEGTVITIVNED